MDGRTGLVIVCAGAVCAWALLVFAIFYGRLRASRVRPPARAATVEGWRLPGSEPEQVTGRHSDGDETRTILVAALRSLEPEVRIASITALGQLAERYEWAVDGLVECLVRDGDDAVKVATELDHLAPRPGPRLPPLLGHPSSTVRFYAVRLLARYDSLAARHVPAMTADRSPNVRAAALETLCAAASGETLRCALRLLDDPSPLVRAQASRTAASVAPLASAPFLVPLLADRSWWVRDAAREGLVASGRDVEQVLAHALESNDEALRSGAALVMQDVGLVDDLVRDEDLGQLDRILEAGGRRLRSAAAERARRGLRLVPGDPLAESA